MTNSVATFATSTSYADNADVEGLFNNITIYYDSNTYKQQLKNYDFV